MAEPADRIPPVQKTFNYFKPDPEPFRAPPVQRTFNYSKPAQDGPATPPRAEGARGFGSTPVGSMPKAPDTFLNKAGDFFFPDAFRPLPNSRKSNFAADMASPLLESAYDLASTATTMTPDPDSYVPEAIQRLGKYATNMGLAGLNAVAAPVYGAAGLAADVANRLGVPRPDALARDFGAMLDSAGILPEGRMLASMLPDVPAPRISRAPEAENFTPPPITPAETIINQTDVAPVTPPAAATTPGQRTPEDIAVEAELDNLILFGTPPPDFLMDRPQNMNRPPEDIAVEAELDRIFGPDQGGVFDPDTEALRLQNMNRQDLADNEVDPFDDPDLFTARYLDDVFPSILERAQRGDPLTDLEAFDVMTFERYGTDGVYDPTNTLDNWVRQRNAVYGAPPTDIEGAERMAFLTGADRTRGQNPVAPVEGPYFLDGLDDIYEAYDEYDQPDLMEYHTMTPTRTLEELNADPEYQNLITADTLTTEQAQRLLDLTFDEFLHRVDLPTPPEGPSVSDIITRLQYLTNTDGYRAYALGMGDPPRQRPQLRTDISSISMPRLKPLTEARSGIASMYSPTRRAVEQLRQSKFPDPVAMEKQLLAGGAKPDELELLLKRIEPSDVAEGGIKKLRLAELADEAATEVQQFRRPDELYKNRHLSGGSDHHVTTFEAPVSGEPPAVGGRQHFAATPGNAVLFHIRSTMFKTPGANNLNVYHLGEIQSDWAQFRTKLFSSNDEYLKAEVEKDRLEEHVQNLNRVGYTHDGSLGNYAQARAKIRKLEDRLGATDTYGFRTYFDEDFPAPYVKTTRKWHQLSLKQALIEAVNSGAEYMSLTTGEQAKSYTNGTLEGQQMFYDQMTPRELDDVLTKFSKEAGVEKPVIEQITIEGASDGYKFPPPDTYTVPAIRITDEFREAMKKYGLPSFAKGGIVTLPI